MAFGWFSKGKNDPDRSLKKAHKLATQARWAEALTYYEEAQEIPELTAEAAQGVRACREKLVDWNLEEAEAFQTAEEPEQAREHAELALRLAGDQRDLAKRARAVLKGLGSPDQGRRPAAPTRMFEPSCGSGCASPCHDTEGEGSDHVAGEELFEFYLEALSPAEQQALGELEGPFRLGFVLLQQGETEAARPHLKAAVKELPDRVGPVYTMGLLASVEANPSAALQHFVKAQKLDPEFAPALHHRADVLRELRRAGEAAGLLDEWLSAHPDDVDALYLLAVCRFESKQAETALEALDQARDLAGDFQLRLELLRGAILRAQGDNDAALVAYRQVVARDPNRLEALVPMGQILIAQGGSAAEGAVEVFKECRRLDPEHGWWHLLRVAEAYAARGWREEARDLLETARGELPDVAQAKAEFEAVQKKVAA